MHDEDRPSRTRKKREAEALQALGERLLELPEGQLAALPLPEPLLVAVREGRRLTQRGALRRQRQYIGRLMRELDTDELQQALAALDQREAHERAMFHAAEEWRDRLMHEGVVALERFFGEHPRAERQRMRHLLLAACRENAPVERRRELFREIRRTLERGL